MSVAPSDCSKADVEGDSGADRSVSAGHSHSFVRGLMCVGALQTAGRTRSATMRPARSCLVRASLHTVHPRQTEDRACADPTRWPNGMKAVADWVCRGLAPFSPLWALFCRNLPILCPQNRCRICRNSATGALARHAAGALRRHRDINLCGLPRERRPLRAGRHAECKADPQHPAMRIALCGWIYTALSSRATAMSFTAALQWPAGASMPTRSTAATRTRVR